MSLRLFLSDIVVLGKKSEAEEGYQQRAGVMEIKGQEYLSHMKFFSFTLTGEQKSRGFIK